LSIRRLRCGIVLRAEEDACQILAGGQVVSVRYASQFPAPRREPVLPGHLVAVAGAPGVSAVVVWRWYDAVVLGSIRINQQWRICFVWSEAGPEDVEIVDYH
jgi:surface antigen